MKKCQFILIMLTMFVLSYGTAWCDCSAAKSCAKGSCSCSTNCDEGEVSVCSSWCNPDGSTTCSCACLGINDPNPRDPDPKKDTILLGTEWTFQMCGAGGSMPCSTFLHGLQSATNWTVNPDGIASNMKKIRIRYGTWYGIFEDVLDDIAREYGLSVDIDPANYVINFSRNKK